MSEKDDRRRALGRLHSDTYRERHRDELRERARARAARFYAAGLTSDGKPRKRPLDWQPTDDPRRAAQREWMQRKRAAMYAAGFTSKGQPRDGSRRPGPRRIDA